MNYDKDLFYKEFVQREESVFHAPYNPELEFYYFVKNGDIDMVRQRLKEKPLVEKPGLGILSKNRLQNMKYHFVITTALVARFCIEGGMSHSNAYTLSDMYIQMADESTSIEQISSIHVDMCMEYATRMKNLNKAEQISRYVRECIDYIYRNLHTKITLDDLAEYVNLNASYLSKLFSTETGVSISDYIINKKISTAQTMLRYSEYTPAQIASILAFSSQSYFNEVFKKRTGMTPTKYRHSVQVEV